MRYLFFDLEMANFDDGEPKICEFGYVVTDEKFVVSEQGNLLVNPDIIRSKWDHFVVRKILTRDICDYEKAPLFSERYDRIVKLIRSSDRIFGHTMAGDARALCSECRRYGLPSIDFTFYDIKEIYKIVGNKSSNTSVTGILDDLLVSASGTAHDAQADAYNTMLGLKAIIVHFRKRVTDLIAMCPQSKDSCEGYEVRSQVIARQQKEKKVRDIISGNAPKRFKLLSFEGKIFAAFSDCVMPNRDVVRKDLDGKRIYIPVSYVESDFKRSVNLVQEIRNHGGVVVHTKKDSNLCVMGRPSKIKPDTEIDANPNRNLLSKTAYAKINAGSGNAEISFDELFSILGVSSEDLGKDIAPMFECLFGEYAYIANKQVREVVDRIKSERAGS